MEKKKISKKKIIKYLDDRIDYYTGGDEMKSMSESVGDFRIVSELKLMKKKIVFDL